MAGPPPLWPQTPPAPGITAEDRSHLDILKICYLISAALSLLSGLFFSLLGAIGLIGLFSSTQSAAMGVFWLVFWFGGGALMLLLAYLEYLVAFSLVEQRRKTLCIVIAAINALNVPLGTALGVFTFIVMFRPQVSAEFDANDGGLVRP